MNDKSKTSFLNRDSVSMSRMSLSMENKRLIVVLFCSKQLNLCFVQLMKHFGRKSK